MKYTLEQEQAIKSRDENILVSAAAGSGKTAVLVERIVKLISEDGLEIDKLLVVTFTEAAAAEMKERVRDALSELLEENPTDGRLLRQIAKLPVASISTIHAFCMSLVKNNFHRIDLDPGFKIGEQAELSLIKDQVMDALFEEKYILDPYFINLVKIFGMGRAKDTNLDKLIRKIFEFLESCAFPGLMAEEYIEVFKAQKGWFDIIRDEMLMSLKEVLNIIARAKDFCRLPFGPEKYLETFFSDEGMVDNLLTQVESAADMYNLYDIFSDMKFDKIYTYRAKEKDEIDEDLRLKTKDLRDKGIKKRVEGIRKRFLFTTPDKMEADVLALQPVISALFKLASEYRDRYNSEKLARGLVDFSDLEHYAIKILWLDDFSPSPVANALSSKYTEVLIDEYQDTNEVQEKILNAISAPRRFMVGDAKQSIYGFRHAQPYLFINKLLNPDIKPIFLSKNFRSRKAVTDTVNFLFERLMSPACGDVPYDETAKLYLGVDTVGNETDYKTEIIINEAIADEEEDDDNDPKIRQEALILSSRIHDMVGKLMVKDGGGLRPCKFSDIVILTRSVRQIAAALVEELKNLGINVVLEVSGGFYDTPEIMMALSLLKIVDNPRQDIDLLALMRLYNFSPDEMLEIRHIGEINLKEDKQILDYYDCLLYYIENGEDKSLCRRLSSLTEDIGNWRRKAVIHPISMLISIIYEETGLLNYFGTMPGGSLRCANLRLLLEKAIQYEATSYTGLFHFVKYVQWLKANEIDESTAANLPDNDSVVRVMTIHKSKGLEFPVVFVSMLGRGLNQMDMRANVILHPEYGIGSMHTDLKLKTRANTISRLALSLKRRQEAISEELRILYVALTRAKEKLVLTGCVTKLDYKLKAWQTLADYHDAIPVQAIREAKSFLDLLMPCALQAQDIIDVNVNPALEPGEFIQTDIPMPAELFTIAQYETIQEAELPAKLSISELKRIYALEKSPGALPFYEEDINFEPPQFYKPVDLSPLRIGTNLHTIIEFMDLTRDIDEKSVLSLIASLVGKGLITKEEAGAIDTDKIIRFASSPLARRMRSARRLHREVPFVMGLSLEEIYGKGHAEETILVHGIIDCYFETAEGDIILVDFKNDSRPDTLHIRYKTQMEIYKKAVERATGKKVSESIFYSFL